MFIPLLFSCQKEDIDDPFYNINNKKVERTVLIYAVNKSSLSYDFTTDSNEILQAASQIDLKKYQILVYKTDSNQHCGLYTVKKDNKGNLQYSLIQSFDRDVTSTHPERIKDVINLSLQLFPNSKYDLIFWGHGMSWKPYFTDHSVAQSGNYFAYGGEFNGDKDESGKLRTDWTEIDELADAVPDNVFDMIWFDCCYMTGIEVIYEFRNKCNTFVGYPSEVWSEGLQYNLILPYIMSPSHNIVAAANTFFNYYNDNREPVTIAVIDMTQLENVADWVRKIIHSGAARPASYQLLNYSRTAGSPFYDFKQFFNEVAALNYNSELSDSFNKALDKMIIYHDGSEKDFNFKDWDVTNISGLSTHFYQNGTLPDEDYYESLDWFDRVYR